MSDSSNVPLRRSRKLLKVAIRVTEERLQVLLATEDTPQIIADRKFYTERLAILREWQAALIDEDSSPPE